MKVLVVCEDPTHDQYIVKPIVQRIFSELGKKADVEVLHDPHLRGIDDLVDQLSDIVRDNLPMVDVFVVVADNDCNRQGNNAARIDAAAAGSRALGAAVVICCAIEEVETWLLAVHRDRFEKWSDVRAECDPKERYALSLLRQLGTFDPGHGRKAAMRGLGQEWRGLLKVCPEISDLMTTIRVAMGS